MFMFSVESPFGCGGGGGGGGDGVVVVWLFPLKPVPHAVLSQTERDAVTTSFLLTLSLTQTARERGARGPLSSVQLQASKIVYSLSRHNTCCKVSVRPQPARTSLLLWYCTTICAQQSASSPRRNYMCSISRYEVLLCGKWPALLYAPPNNRNRVTTHRHMLFVRCTK